MTDETDAPQGGAEAEAIVQAPQVDTPSEATTDQPTATETAAEPDAGAEPDKPKQVPWFQKRIDEVTRQKYEEQRRADYLEGQLAALRQPAKQPEPAGPPTLEQFDWDEARYQQASAQFYREEARRAAREELQAVSTEQQQKARLETATNRLKEGAARHSDFEQVVHDIPITDAVSELLVNDVNAAAVLYQAGRDPAEKARIFSLPPYLQAVELGKIAARLEAPQAATPKPIPPAPPQTVAGLSAGLNKTPDEMSFAEFKAWREAEDKT